MDNLPKGWKVNKLIDICSRITDGSHFSPKTIENGFAYVTVKDISDSGEIDIENCKKISEKAFNELVRGNCEPIRDDVLLSKDGTVGKTALVNINQRFVVLSSLAILSPLPSMVHSRFLYLFLNSPSFQEKAISSKTGAAIKRIVLKNIKEFQIPIPPLSEQTRIVAKLDALFARIDKSIALLEENIKHTKALMASVLEELFEKLKKESTIYKIKEIAEIKGGKRLPKGESIQEEKTDYPYIRVTDFTDNGTIDVNSVKYMTKSVQEQIKRYIITSKDLYISIAGTIGKTGIIPKELENANLTENAARLVFKPNIKINNRFVYYFTLSDNFKDQVGLATKTVAQPKLALTRLSEVELPIPAIEVQNKEVEIFDDLKRKFIKINDEQQSKLVYLKALKSSLLDRSFKGEL